MEEAHVTDAACGACVQKHNRCVTHVIHNRFVKSPHGIEVAEIGIENSGLEDFFLLLCCSDDTVMSVGDLGDLRGRWESRDAVW